MRQSSSSEARPQPASVNSPAMSCVSHQGQSRSTASPQRPRLHTAAGAPQMPPSGSIRLGPLHHLNLLLPHSRLGQPRFNTGGRVDQAAQESKRSRNTQFYDLVGRTPAANSYELDFAKALIQASSSDITQQRPCDHKPLRQRHSRPPARAGPPTTNIR